MADDDLLREEPPRPVPEVPVAPEGPGDGAVPSVPAEAATKKVPARRVPARKTPAVKKTAARKAAAKKTAAKTTAAAKKTPAVEKTAAKKAAAKRPVARKSSATKAATKQTAANKTAANKTAAKKTTAGATAAERARAGRVTPAAPGPDFGPAEESPTSALPPPPSAWEAPSSEPAVPPPSGSRTTWAPPPAKPPKAPKAPKAPKPHRLRRILLVLIALAALAATAFFVAKAFDKAGNGEDYSTLKVGDCLETPSGTEVKGVETQPCAGPHDAEVYAVVQHPAPPGAPYPGVPALVDFAGRSCLGQAFTDYVGRPRADSTLKNLEIVPKRSAWDDGRRQMVCAVDNAGGPKLTGSVRGTSR